MAAKHHSVLAQGFAMNSVCLFICLSVCFQQHFETLSLLSSFAFLIHPLLGAPVRGQMFTGVLATEKHGEIFTGELKVCT